MSADLVSAARSRVVAVNVSSGGIPKRPVDIGNVTVDGLVGDGHNHAKHIRRDRAISLLDLEILEQLVQEGFELEPGAAGENLTVAGLHVQELSPGTVLQIGDVFLRLEQPRKPCYVLDSVSPRLKDAILGRCGYMASVLSEGRLHPGASVSVVCSDEIGKAGYDQTRAPSCSVDSVTP